MKKHLSFLSILLFLSLMLPQVAFADVLPPPPDDDNNNSDCSALLMSSHTSKWSVLLILMVSVGAISFGAISRVNKKQDDHIAS